MKNEEPQFISLAEAAKITNYSQDYISLLCRQGKMKAEKLGRNWVTTRDWVYSYIDNTEGKGKSIVPVKVKDLSEKETDKKERKEKKEKNHSNYLNRRPLGGNMVIEFLIFAFVILLLLSNVVNFIRYNKDIDLSYNCVKDNVAAEQSILKSLSSQKAESSNAAAAPSCSKSDSLQLFSFEQETDTATIEKVKIEVGSKFSEEVDVEVYKSFAIVNYKNRPTEKFLYVFND